MAERSLSRSHLQYILTIYMMDNLTCDFLIEAKWWEGTHGLLQEIGPFYLWRSCCLCCPHDQWLMSLAGSGSNLSATCWTQNTWAMTTKLTCCLQKKPQKKHVWRWGSHGACTSCKALWWRCHAMSWLFYIINVGSVCFSYVLSYIKSLNRGIYVIKNQEKSHCISELAWSFKCYSFSGWYSCLVCRWPH